jgi:hypothetical protein
MSHLSTLTPRHLPFPVNDGLTAAAARTQPKTLCLLTALHKVSGKMDACGAYAPHATHFTEFLVTG